MRISTRFGRLTCFGRPGRLLLAASVICIVLSHAVAQDIIVYRADFPGNLIAFPNNGELFLVEGLGSNPVQLTNRLTPQWPALSPDGTEVAFVSRLNISKMQIRNRRVEPLTFNADRNVSYSDLDWSPDGRELLFLVFNQNETELCVMDMEDNSIRHIRRTSPPNDLHRPSWDPDGARILFAELVEEIDIDGRRRTRSDLFVIDKNGGAVVNITNTPDRPEFLPVWSPGRNRIAFLASVPPPPNPFQIYVMDINGRNPLILAASGVNRIPLAWSQDGAKILFRSEDNGADSGDIYVMAANGANIVNLTNSPARELTASWSPDSQRIVFDARIADNEIAIFLMDADGQNRRRLTFGPGLNGAPDWSPDGDRIAFMSNRTGRLRIYTMDIDGRNIQQTTNHQREFDFFPVWSPDGKSIAFISGNNQEVGLYVMDLQQATERLIISSPAIAPLRPAWTPDGRSLIYTEIEATGQIFNSSDTVLMMIGVGGGAPLKLSEDTLMDWSYPVMSPDGKSLLFSAQRIVNDLIGPLFVMNIDGSGQRQLQARFPLEFAFLDLVWSPDGQRMMASGLDFAQGRSVIYLVDVAAETAALWREDAIQPDWVKPGHVYSVDARKKLMTTWGSLKARPN